MVADIPAVYAADDDALFDSGQIVDTCKDTRTVGEMLHDADHLARQLLMDVAGDDAGPLLRAWPALVDAGSHLWKALPGRRREGDERDLPMRRLHATTSTFSNSLAGQRSWPGEGPTHTGVDQISETLRTAGDLIARYGAEVPAHQTRTARDIDATRVWVMHTLYVTAHAISVALNLHGKDLVRESGNQGRPIQLSGLHTAYAVQPTVAWVQRAARCENLAHTYLAGRFVTAAHGEATRSVDDHDRMPRALAWWDIQAHRTLAHDPSPANLVLIARSQSLIAGASLVLLDAAEVGESRDVEEALHYQQVRPTITRTATSWSRLGSRWHDLTRPADRLDPALARAASEVRAAYRELTHHVTTQASPEDIATHPGLTRGFAASLDALVSAGGLAYGVAEQAERSDLAGPARALSRRAHDDVEAGRATVGRDEEQVWVSPADIVAKRLVPLPPPVVENLLKVSLDVVQDAMSAAAAARTECRSRGGRVGEDVSSPEGRGSAGPVGPGRSVAFDRPR
jgi:hypothetical protein